MIRIQLDPKPDDIVDFLREREGVVSVNPTNHDTNDGLVTTCHVKAQYYTSKYIGEEGLRFVVVERLSDRAVKAKDVQIQDHVQAIFNPKFEGKDPFADNEAKKSHEISRAERVKGDQHDLETQR